MTAGLRVEAAARRWAGCARRLLDRQRAWRVLHASDRAINLVDGSGEVLAIVADGRFLGPFAIEIDDPGVGLAETVSHRSCLRRTREELLVGSLRVDLRPVEAWDARPAWKDDRGPEGVLPPLPSAPRGLERRAMDRLARALADPENEDLEAAVRDLAGRGGGLTPAGDDVILGGLVALRCRGSELEGVGPRVLEGIVGRTTTLSLAFLRAAIDGEVSAPWHDLVRALTRGAPEGIEIARKGVLEMGSSSGLASLWGFSLTREALARESRPRMRYPLPLGLEVTL